MFIYTSRDVFGLLFMRHFYTGVIAEIGVQNGFNSKRFAKYWSGKILCVDTWTNQKEYWSAQINLQGVQAVMLRGLSVEVAQSVENASLDGVYMDAGHSFEELKADYDAWFPKVRSGGIVSGHDYGDNEFPGVRQFVDGLGIPINLTTDDFWEGGEYQSWWFIKD